MLGDAAALLQQHRPAVHDLVDGVQAAVGHSSVEVEVLEASRQLGTPVPQAVLLVLRLQGGVHLHLRRRGLRLPCGVTGCQHQGRFRHRSGSADVQCVLQHPLVYAGLVHALALVLVGAVAIQHEQLRGVEEVSLARRETQHVSPVADARHAGVLAQLLVRVAYAGELGGDEVALVGLRLHASEAQQLLGVREVPSVEADARARVGAGAAEAERKVELHKGGVAGAFLMRQQVQQWHQRQELAIAAATSYVHAEGPTDLRRVVALHDVQPLEQQRDLIVQVAQQLRERLDEGLPEGLVPLVPLVEEEERQAPLLALLEAGPQVHVEAAAPNSQHARGRLAQRQLHGHAEQHVGGSDGLRGAEAHGAAALVLHGGEVQATALGVEPVQQLLERRGVGRLGGQRAAVALVIAPREDPLLALQRHRVLCRPGRPVALHLLGRQRPGEHHGAPERVLRGGQRHRGAHGLGILGRRQGRPQVFGGRGRRRRRQQLELLVCGLRHAHEARQGAVVQTVWRHEVDGVVLVADAATADGGHLPRVANFVERLPGYCRVQLAAHVLQVAGAFLDGHPDEATMLEGLLHLWRRHLPVLRLEELRQHRHAALLGQLLQLPRRAERHHVVVREHHILASGSAEQQQAQLKGGRPHLAPSPLFYGAGTPLMCVSEHSARCSNLIG
eukprot:scaffold2094_cov239-Pinguiococcus_pyrenoidosus.AAC.9